MDGFDFKASAGKMWLLVDPRVDSQGNIVASFMVMDERPSSQLKKFNSKLEPILDIATLKLARAPVLDPRFPRMYWDVMKDDRIIYGIQTKYELCILDSEGKLIKKIVKDYEPVDFTREDREKILKRLYGDQSPPSDVRFDWPKYHLAFRSFSVDDEGRIFVRTYERKKGMEKGSEYDVFDPEGRYIARVHLNVLPFIWKKGKMYTIFEDEEGYRFVKRYNVRWE